MLAGSYAEREIKAKKAIQARSTEDRRPWMLSAHPAGT